MLALLDKKLKKCINYLLTIKIKFNVLIINFEYSCAVLNLRFTYC